MELDDLKSIWKKGETSFQPKNDQEIAMMLKGKSISIIEKLKRSVWLELILTGGACVAFLIYALSLESGAAKWTYISLLLVFLVYTIYYIKKLILLNDIPRVNENLHESISRLTVSLTSYLKFYKNSYAILYPVFFVLGLLFGAIERGPEKYVEYISRPKTIAYLIGMAVVFFFLSSWFATWYLKKLYGNHLDKLKALLKELDTN